ncbi:MAG: serine/threonine dehydratase [Alphaproteobacteria bacterium]|nr:serine/threonine dehydratase [Alphaproteobacteria bacterium]
MTTRTEIETAHLRIRGDIRRTPLLWLDPWLCLKLECLQRGGSFKSRGAFNRLRSAGELSRGVVAASGGNHGVAVALAAQALGARADIFVPEISAAAKRGRIQGFGAKLVVGGATYFDALAASTAHARTTGAVVVHAYDQPEVLAGQGTVALEWQQDAPGLTHVLVAVGGGGLIGGMAAWYAGQGVQVIAVEPETSCALHAAMQAGRPVDVPVSGVAADSLGARSVGALMFDIARQHVAQCVLVANDAITAAQKHLWQTAQVVAEPGGAAAMAALLSGAWRPPPGARVGVLVCGANCDPASVGG